ncbi:MAG: hypothetical protein L0Y79_10070 [Chlorobi bacterium]|nr:hypothetical protein [Chlorobiota bacterium]MCI0715215.1 hypothetical protein [Chlorobiota bacterium]
MKSLITDIVIFFFIVSAQNAQEQIKIPENGSTEICGREVIVDGIWMNDWIIKADISVLGSPNSKSITGGYKKGDQITISGSEGCFYYVLSITKSGLNQNKGNVTLTKVPPVVPIQICEDTILWYESKTFKIDTLDWNIASVKKDKDSSYAEVKVYYNKEPAGDFLMKDDENIWLGECLYKVSEMNEQVAVSMGNKWELQEGRIILTKVNDYFYSSGNVIEGEDINKPKGK